MAIPNILAFDETRLPIEGTTEFRANASYVWSTIPAVIDSWNTSITWVNGTVTNMNQISYETETYKNNALSYRNDALSYRNASSTYMSRAEIAANMAESVVIPTTASYSVDAIDTALNSLLTQSVAQTAQISILRQG